MTTLGPFADLPDPYRGAVEQLAARRRFGAGQRLFGKGEPATEVLVVQSGLVAVQVEGPDERRLTLALLGEEDVLGEMALAGVPRRTASVIAVRDTEVLALPADRLAAMRGSAQAIDAVVMAVLADTVRRLTTQVLEATLLPQAVRLRRILLRLHRHHDHGRITMTHHQLAEVLGAQRTTVTELLAAEAAEGRISTGRGYVQVEDLAALREAPG